MSAITTIVWILNALAVGGILIVISFLPAWLYSKWKLRKLKKNIPIKTIQEVENARTKKQRKSEDAGRRYARESECAISREAEEADSNIRRDADIQERRSVQVLSGAGDLRDESAAGEDERDTEQDWPSFG